MVKSVMAAATAKSSSVPRVLNPKTDLCVKRNTDNGQFLDVKTSGGKFKGVRKEK
jgi:hypothetical protein